MNPITIDISAALAATIIVMIAGMIWYSNPLFGRPWARMSNLSQKDLGSGMTKAFILAFIGNLLSALALGLLVGLTQPLTIGSAIFLGVLFWIAVALPIGFSQLAWEKRPFTLVLINAGWSLVQTLIIVGFLYWWPW